MLHFYWKKLSNYGEQMLMSPDAHRQNRILNHGLIYAIGLYFTTYVVALVYFYFLIRLDSARYSAYFWPYTAACLLPAFATAGLFYLRGRPGFSTVATVAAYAISIAHNLSMLLFMGLGGGFQFFLAALLPAAYLAHPHRRLVYIPLYAATVSALVGGMLWCLTHVPWFPVPEPFAATTFYTVLATASGFFIVCFVYVAYKYDWVKRVMVYWEALSVYGLKWTDSDDERTHHIITNQTMVLHAFFPPVIFSVSLVLSAVLIWQGTPGWWKHLIAFTLAALIPAGLWAMLFVQAAKRWRSGFLYIYMLVDLLLISYLVFITGSQFGIQYFYFALIPLPIYLFPDRRRLITGEVLAIASAIFGVFFAERLKPLLAAPVWLVEPVYLLVISLIVLSLTLGGIYIWWQRKVSSRIIGLWHALSLLGVSDDLAPADKKIQILVNRLFLVGLGYLVVAYSFGHFFNTIQLARNNYSNFIPSTVAYSSPTLNGILFSIIFFFFRTRKPHLFIKGGVLYNLLPTIFSSVFTSVSACVSVLFQEEAFFHFVFLIIAIAAFVLRSLVSASGWHWFSVLLPLSAFFGSIWLYRHTNGLMPIPDYILMSTKIFVIGGMVTAILAMVHYLAYESSISESALEVAHQKSESLLLNILPRDVADELKDKGHSAPVRIESVTVMFTDFAGFTQISESLSPEQVVDELDKCFSYFDQIMEKYNLEKLKTIGDSYMCAGGIPKPNHTHAIDCCLAAMEIQSFMNQMRDIKAMQGLPYWELRLGIHTGPLVAGVVGHKKFAYDVWGDTVNTASRMESSGTTGKINISFATYECVKFLFDCTHRGQIAAKNKGMIEMYYLDGIRAKFSAGGDGRGRVPNRRFKEIYAAVARGARLMPRVA